MSKGDKQIPAAVPQEQVTLNWSNTFGKSRLERMLEAEQLARDLELMQSVQEGLAKMADPVSLISELPELQEMVKQGLADGTLIPS